jgi:hypothetical protein
MAFSLYRIILTKNLTRRLSPSKRNISKMRVAEAYGRS